MLKFKGRFEERSRWKDGFGTYDIDVPTVDEVDEVLAPMVADTVLQILHGQGIYWGWKINDNGHFKKGARLPTGKTASKYDEKLNNKLLIARIRYQERIRQDEIIEARRKQREKDKRDYLRKKRRNEQLLSDYRGLPLLERKAIQIIKRCNKCTTLTAYIRYIEASEVAERKRINDYVLGAR